MRFAAFTLLLFLASSGYAQEPPFDFKGIALGSDISSIENTSRFSCRDPQSPIADRVCSLKFGERETIAGASVEVLLLYYYSGKLETISISFSAKHFSEVAAALTEKYGAGSVKTEAVQNRMGATFENKIYSWRRDNATLEAKRYSSKLDRSSVMYRTDFAQQEFARRRGTTVKEKAKDL
ncbi:MAG TPA: hypothetical protein DCQ64_30860 [Candidatus Rokubacteria bacterium]|nr:hypothetical protein [Candidatus Rokubacteria bacterium]HAZ07978.1 hypothetical protein [Elusimicrobiota bacterium]